MSDSTQVAVLDHRVSKLEDITESIDESLKTLVRLEEKHSQTQEALKRAFTEIENNGKRLTALEGEMPTMKMVRGWVITGVRGVAVIVGLAVIALVVK